MAEPTAGPADGVFGPSTRTLTVRFFAAAKAAAGTGEARIPVAPGATVDDLLGALAERYGTELGGVVAHSSFLLDGIGVDRADRIGTAAGLDILPPFAGG
ncbi:MAG: MoaD/ThiS family protein [Nakamurella sp.]